MPYKIFTVQNEPPVWDDNDDAGLESVSEPDMSDDDRGTTGSSPITNRHEDEEEEEMLRDEFTTTTKNAIEIETDQTRIAASKSTAISRAEDDDAAALKDNTKQGNGMSLESKPRPPKPRPLQSMGPMGSDTQSWIRPVSSGQEAPNGGNVL